MRFGPVSLEVLIEKVGSDLLVRCVEQLDDYTVFLNSWTIYIEVY